eukprot:TRINITY_DN49269_c0_g1_i1.p2 TRINITY_DN49269_c0_g1~~TRINITY_DN49269_c0_g1_i1.p2  ORF type:complete len:109 (+),score=18.28 TRINITY_DN49269_c0_g1_i1:122-448(+)
MQLQSHLGSIAHESDRWSRSSAGSAGRSPMCYVRDNQGGKHQPESGIEAEQPMGTAELPRPGAVCQRPKRDVYDFEPMAGMERSAKERRLLEKMQGLEVLKLASQTLI